MIEKLELWSADPDEDLRKKINELVREVNELSRVYGKFVDAIIETFDMNQKIKLQEWLDKENKNDLP